MDDFGKLAAIAGSTSAEIGFSMTRFDPGPQAVNPAVVITNKKLKRKSVTGIVIDSVAQRGKSQASQKTRDLGHRRSLSYSEFKNVMRLFFWVVERLW